MVLVVVFLRMVPAHVGSRWMLNVVAKLFFMATTPKLKKYLQKISYVSRRPGLKVPKTCILHSYRSASTVEQDEIPKTHWLLLHASFVHSHS